MTDEQIIKALECCIGQEGNCDECPQHSRDCVDDLLKTALDLINRQKAEIERVTAERDKAVKDFTKFARSAYAENPFACKYCVHFVEDSGGCLWKEEHEKDREGCFGRHFEYRETAGAESGSQAFS